ncbi:MAG TPA: ATP-binding protein [Methylomirabilota bacterium]|nr:ATP-binding protein [Methylomirabilota bacterium]
MSALSIHTRLTLWYTGVLLATLVVVSALSYSLLAWNLAQDVDHSLLTVAEVVRDTNATDGDALSPERILRDALGSNIFDQFFQIVDPEGTPSIRSQSPGRPRLPLSGLARTNAARGRPTFETLRVGRGPDLRVVTLPVMRNGRLTEVVQVGMSLAQSERSLRRYLQSLFVLVPLGVLLAAIGGVLMARAALRPVDQMSAAARRITAAALGQRVRVRGTGDELDRLAETLNGMLGRLEAAFAEIRRFSADAAHELRTPLTALKGGLEVALRAERTPEEYRRVIADSLEEVERLIRLAEDLMLLSRSSSVPETRRDAVDLEPLVLDVLDVGARLAAGTGVAVRLKEAAPVTVRGNATALRRAVLNLVENAVKYTPAGGIVELAVTHEGDAAVLAVEDTGPGIAAEDAERVFEPFVRLDAARARDLGGSGLGLAIARSIVAAHDGSIAIERGAAGGARFTIRLPAG